jgi:hypothetical protein
MGNPADGFLGGHVSAAEVVARQAQNLELGLEAFPIKRLQLAHLRFPGLLPDTLHGYVR